MKQQALRTTELGTQTGLVKEAALQALGGSAAGGYTLMVTAPRRSQMAIKCAGLGALLVIASVAYLVIMAINKFWGSNTWDFHWGVDAMFFVAGLAVFGIGVYRFLSIEMGSHIAAIFDSAVSRVGKASWLNQTLSSLIYTGQVEANVVVRYPVHHKAKGKNVDLDFVFFFRLQAKDLLSLFKIGVEAAWLSMVTKFSELVNKAVAVTEGDYEAVMAAKLPENAGWVDELSKAFAATQAGSPLAFLSLGLVDVRPPEFLRHEEEKAMLDRVAEEKRILDKRKAFGARRSLVTSDSTELPSITGDHFDQIVADIKAAALPSAVIDEEVRLTEKAKAVFLQESVRRAAEARERVRAAAQGPVKAFLLGLDDADADLDELCRRFHNNPTKVLLFLESQRLAAGSSRTPSLSNMLVQFADPSRMMLPPDGEHGISLRFAEDTDEPAGSGKNGQVGEKEGLGTVPLEARG